MSDVIRKNLGRVSLLLEGTVEPTNKRMLWYDTSTEKILKYNFTNLTWEDFAGVRYVNGNLVSPDGDVIQVSSDFFFGTWIAQDYKLGWIAISTDGTKFWRAKQDFNSLVEPTSNNAYWEVVFESVSSGGGTIGVEFVVTENQGTYKPGDVILSTDPTSSVVKNMLSKILYPTFTSPSISITNNGGLVREIGTTHNTQITLNFNKGSILGKIVNNVWSSNSLQAPRAGNASKFYIQDIKGSIDVSNTPTGDTTTYSYTFNNHSVVKGWNDFYGYVDHLIGVQPTDSTGANYSTPLPANRLEASSNTRYEGVWGIYASTVDISTATRQPLVSMISGNDIVMDLVSETSNGKQFFEIPNEWLSSRNLLDVEYYNAASGKFDLVGKKSDFEVTTNIRTINGVNVSFSKFTNKGTSLRGSVKIRLKF